MNSGQFFQTDTDLLLAADKSERQFCQKLIPAALSLPLDGGGCNSATLTTSKFPIERCPPRALSRPAQAAPRFLQQSYWIGPCCPSMVVMKMRHSLITILS